LTSGSRRANSSSAAQQDDKARLFLHRGIPAGSFQRTFVLADGIDVLGPDLKERSSVD